MEISNACRDGAYEIVGAKVNDGKGRAITNVERDSSSEIGIRNDEFLKKRERREIGRDRKVKRDGLNVDFSDKTLWGACY